MTHVKLKKWNFMTESARLPLEDVPDEANEIWKASDHCAWVRLPEHNQSLLTRFDTC